MTDAEWRDVCVEHCWLDIDLHILNAMRKAYELGFEHAAYEAAPINGRPK